MDQTKLKTAKPTKKQPDQKSLFPSSSGSSISDGKEAGKKIVVVAQVHHPADLEFLEINPINILENITIQKPQEKEVDIQVQSTDLETQEILAQATIDRENIIAQEFEVERTEVPKENQDVTSKEKKKEKAKVS